MAVRSALPWPVRWIGAAVVLGFSAAISLWAFEFGKDIAGLERNVREEVAVLRLENQRLREERDKVQSVVNTSESLRVADRVAQEKLVAQLRQLETDNRALREDLGFFENLLPASEQDTLSIRGLQAERLPDDGRGSHMRWQVLVMQPTKNAPEFNGRLELTFSGTLGGKPWTLALPEGPTALRFKQYLRLDGVVDLPAGAVVKNVSAKVSDSRSTRAVHNLKL